MPHPAARPAVRLGALVLVAALALGGCGEADGADGAHGHDDGEAPGAACADLEPFGDFGEVLVTIGGEERCLLLAQTPEQRARGLMEVTDLEGYPGMLFAFPQDSSGGFWMRNTPTALSIAYLDASGAIVSTADMAPCEDDPSCPSYPADGPYRMTVEVPRGELAALGLTGDARLTVESEIHPS
ncbi:MAG: DUF192 domain-containing protein [Acidimicrobiales bacterium]|nr:DUF192 domain-containing protein [Acidimicrobiales bacterium]MCB1015563.1 DUF192 domain-containing protein [Acidimicrobiales bacterium]MCB9372408.1 DUF192 domain-containing protein [Microthrixaceae bacterium]